MKQVVTAEQQRALCHLTAIVKGFLIRRLLKTEKVKHLRQTIQVRTQHRVHIRASESLTWFIILIPVYFLRTRKSLSVHSALMLLGETSLCQSRISLCRSASEHRSHFCNALILKDQCIQHYNWNLFLFQLRAALFDIHDIFFSMTLEERLSLLQQDRELRTERKLREMVTGRTDLRFAFMFIGWLLILGHCWSVCFLPILEKYKVIFIWMYSCARQCFFPTHVQMYLACRKKQRAPRTRWFCRLLPRNLLIERKGEWAWLNAL